MQKTEKLKIINHHLKKIHKLSVQTKTEVFIVGGFIRDFLMDELSSDIDFAVFKNTKKFTKNIAAHIKGSFVVLDEKEKSYRVVKKIKGEIFTFDFTKIRGKNLDEDLKSRDFSINALAIDLNNNGKSFSFPKNKSNIKNIIDKTNALNDIKNKIVKKIKNDIFEVDAIRLLRAFRLAAKYNFKIDIGTKDLIQKKAKLIKNSSKERIHDELIKLFSYENIFDYILQMDSTKLLENIFEKISFMKTQNEYYYHTFGLWGHSLEVLFCLEFIFKNISKIFKKNKNILEIFNNYFDTTKNTNLAKIKLLCLFHDIGKPECFSITNNKVHFFKHDELSGKYIKKILKELKFSNKEINFIKDAAIFHMQAGNLIKEKIITDRACFRFFKRTKEIGLGLLFFTLADWLASIRGSKKISYLDSIKISEFQYLDFKRCKKAIIKIINWYITDLNKKSIEKYINGKDIMQKFKLKEGKLIGEILDTLEEAQAINLIKNKKDAYEFVRKYLEK
jgi:poly(A) polymerase